ncbi:MAG: neutral zinc metallopeptidase [Gemmatimonadaceae bacterium]
MLNRLFPQGVSKSIVAVLGFGVPGSLYGPAELAVDEPGRVRVTAEDIRAANAEADAAYDALVTMWSEEFDAAGKRFSAPKVVRYRGNIVTQCGVMPASNATYCLETNTIYFDDAFVAGQAKLTGRALGSDGDMAAVGIVAHEMGHAVAFQLGHIFRDSYKNESVADCLTGAFARWAEQDGSLEEGDLDEVSYAMSAAADPDLRATGNRRLDRRRAAAIARTSHGTREQRLANFRNGFYGGSGSCVPDLS